jgi:vacuolar-type H+-ATPase subunit I/STV1
MNGAAPLLPLYAFMAWTGGKQFTLHIYRLHQFYQIANTTNVVHVYELKMFLISATCFGLLGLSLGTPINTIRSL